ncbi:MAG TPA: STAS domain-containing protein [Streptosporangiaceae bacterium]
MSSLQVSVVSGESGPVLVLAGEADLTSITRLDEALTAHLSGQTVRLTIDATNLRFADLASVRSLATAARKASSRAGSVTLLNPQPPIVKLLDLLCIDGIFATGDGTEPDQWNIEPPITGSMEH